MVLKILDRLEELIVMSLIALATLVTFAAVVHRYLSGWAVPYMQDYLLSLSFSWAQELCIILFVWMAKFGAAYGVRTGIHVGVDVLIDRLEPAWRNKLIVFGLFAGAFFTGFIAVVGMNFVWRNGMDYALCGASSSAWCASLVGSAPLYMGPTTPDLEWPTWAVYMAIPLGSALMCFRFLQVAWIFWRTGELPHHDPGHVEGLDEGVQP